MDYADPSQIDGCTAAIEGILLSFTVCLRSLQFFFHRVFKVSSAFLQLGGRRVLLIKAGCDRSVLRALKQSSVDARTGRVYSHFRSTVCLRGH